MSLAVAVIVWAVAVAVVLVLATLVIGAILGLVRLAAGRDKFGNRVEPQTFDLADGATAGPPPIGDLPSHPRWTVRS